MPRANAQLSPLEPTWFADFPRGVEWAEVAGEPATTLVICDRSNGIHLFNLRTGARLVDAPISMGSGARFGGFSAQTVYLLDRYVVAAIDIPATLDGTQTTKERWRIGDWSDAARKETGDPEFLPRVVAVAVADGGVLAARSDGLVAFVQQSDGKVRWRSELPASSDIIARASGDQISMLLRAKGQPVAAFVPYRHALPTPTIRPLDKSWPTWSAATPTGLIAAWPGVIVRQPPAGDHVVLASRLGGVRAAAIDVQTHEPPGDAPQAGALLKSTRVFFADPGGGIRAIDADNGKPLWATPKSDDRKWSRLSTVGGVVLVADDRGRFAGFDVRDGGEIARWSQSEPARFFDFEIDGRYVWAVRLARDRNRPALELDRTTRFAPGGWDEKQARESEVRYALAAESLPRQTLWPRGRLVLVEGNRVRTFVRPE
ncbi:MAG: PQQ-binding-like beta-propeller repeat protein [Phycisphaerae bacterium]